MGNDYAGFFSRETFVISIVPRTYRYVTSKVRARGGV